MAELLVENQPAELFFSGASLKADTKNKVYYIPLFSSQSNFEDWLESQCKAKVKLSNPMVTFAQPPIALKSKS